MNWSAGGTSWLEGLSAFGVLAALTADGIRRRRRRRHRPPHPDA